MVFARVVSWFIKTNNYCWVCSISPETYQILLLAVSKTNRLHFLLAQTPVNLMVDQDLR